MKLFMYHTSPLLIEYDSSIRRKVDIIKLLLNVIRLSKVKQPEDIESINTSNEEEKIDIIICINKMSRVFICEKNKIHTFQLPFIIKQNGSNLLDIYFNGYLLDSEIISKCIRFFNELGDVLNIEEIIEILWKEVEEGEPTKNNIINELIIYLMLFESGYLRCDYDSNPERVNEITHPINHLDMYYSSRNTFKIGLKRKYKRNDLINLVNIESPCVFIQD